MRLLLGLILLALLCSCAPMDKNECLEANWYQLGRQDGVRAQPRSLFARRTEACREHGVVADREAYYRGREDGIRLYCTPDNGYRLGRKGGRYTYICPSDLEQAFIARYNEGVQDYRFEQRVQRLEKQIADLEESIAVHEKELIAPKVPPLERAQIYIEIKELQQQKQQLEDELAYLLGG